MRLSAWQPCCRPARSPICWRWPAARGPAPARRFSPAPTASSTGRSKRSRSYKPCRPAEKTRKANRRKSERYEVKTLVYLDLETGTLPGVSIDIGEHGLAVQATEPVPMGSNLAFRCVLPGTKVTLHGHADVMWASDQGRAGLFFSKLSPAARKHLKQWLHKRSAHSKQKTSTTCAT